MKSYTDEEKVQLCWQADALWTTLHARVEGLNMQWQTLQFSDNQAAFDRVFEAQRRLTGLTDKAALRGLRRRNL